ncbi:peflin [Anaeramoeba ignava]|uniref:Peflin n=1 Tax=Anaeramoeba ignava TaxID=1746090 RepID=A0A9Q0LPC9_ANAIG|nr:peflin [Anaeramoeba ignava]
MSYSSKEQKKKQKELKKQQKKYQKHLKEQQEKNQEMMYHQQKQFQNQMMQQQQQQQQMMYQQQPMMMGQQGMMYQQQPMMMGQQGMMMGGQGMMYQQQPMMNPEQMLMNQLTQWFQQVDTDHSGFIDSIELAKALSLSFEKFDAGTSDKLIRMFSKTQDSKVNFQEFVLLYKFMKLMQTSFQEHDKDHSGLLEIDELLKALHKAGFGHLKKETILAIIDKFGKKGKIHYDGYIALCIFLQLSANVFNAWDTQRKDKVELTFPTYVLLMLQSYF